MATRVPRYVAPSSINATHYKQSNKCEHTRLAGELSPRHEGVLPVRKKHMAGWLAGLDAHLIEVMLPNEKKKHKLIAHHMNYIVAHQEGVRSHGAAPVYWGTCSEAAFCMKCWYMSFKNA